MGVGKRLCADPAVEDHRSLCNAAARVVGGICHRYGAAYTNLQPRITKALFEAVADSARPLSTRYGAWLPSQGCVPRPLLGGHVRNCLRPGPRLGSD